MHDRIENRSISSRMTRSNSSYISPIDYIVQAPSRASTSQIRESYNIKIDKENIARPILKVRVHRQEPESLKIFSERNENFSENGSKILMKKNNMIFKKNFIKILWTQE
ncbi:hypothetical protein H5410_002365 [Solanum commersonii]|uniref:Uncharacterized protein n=1 Tax=Solanum commersonii TaxID=4109 RepID=A0A9J6B1V0_SOLCO|nr:hypothetical protein H5410_002365 [Solanum commersonii]